MNDATTNDATPQPRITSAADLLTAYAAGRRDFHGANLRDADLRGADLRGAYLRGAYLSGAHLTRADLRDANLRDADLYDANLSGADLRDADLRDADLRDANLSGANLTRADLSGADLRDADLRGADLRGAYLSGAHLTRADLSGAHLTRADLSGANLRDAHLRGADLYDAHLRRANTGAIRADLYEYLARVPREVPGLLAALEAGRIDGSTYDGPCACLAGTCERLASDDGADMAAITPLVDLRDAHSPRERWFLAIRPGDTPENSPVAALTAQWIEAWLAEHPQATATASESLNS